MRRSGTSVSGQVGRAPHLMTALGAKRDLSSSASGSRPDLHQLV